MSASPHSPQRQDAIAAYRAGRLTIRELARALGLGLEQILAEARDRPR